MAEGGTKEKYNKLTTRTYSGDERRFEGPGAPRGYVAEHAQAEKYLLKLEFFHVPTGRKVAFLAYLKNLNETYSSDWGGQAVYGRMDSIANFRATQRQFTLGWTVPAYDLRQAELNQAKVDLLISMLYPRYEDGEAATARAITAAPIIGLKFGNVIQSQVDGGYLFGYLSGLNYNPNFDQGAFKVKRDVKQVNIGKNKGEHKFASVTIHPKIIECGCSFTVLHTHRVGWNDEKPDKAVHTFPHGGGIAPGISGFATNPDPKGGAAFSLDKEIIQNNPDVIEQRYTGKVLKPSK